MSWVNSVQRQFLANGPIFISLDAVSPVNSNSLVFSSWEFTGKDYESLVSSIELSFSSFLGHFLDYFPTLPRMKRKKVDPIHDRFLIVIQ